MVPENRYKFLNWRARSSGYFPTRMERCRILGYLYHQAPRVPYPRAETLLESPVFNSTGDLPVIDFDCIAMAKLASRPDTVPCYYGSLELPSLRYCVSMIRQVLTYARGPRQDIAPENLKFHQIFYSDAAASHTRDIFQPQFRFFESYIGTGFSS